MTKVELINKIRNNRSFDLRASEFYEPFDVSGETIKDMADDFYYLLKDVLNYLVGKEEPVSEDLEAAIDTYLATYFGGEKEKQEWPFLKKMAIHFAEWQKQKDANLIFNAKEDGYRLGLATMKQQIMKEAVEVPIEEAVPFGSCKWKLCAKLWLDKGVKGNKVKLIIIKEDCI